MFDLTGKVAVVTGASRGIGQAIAETMAAQGAKVVVSSRKADACQTVADGIKEKGGEAVVIPCNISHGDQLENLAKTTLDTLGQVDILVCNAAANPYFGPLKDVPEDAYDKTMDTNIKRNLQLCNLLIPQMAERGGGSVIIISSIAAVLGTDKLGTYALSKAADVSLARSLAVEWGPKNVRVNAILPGLIRTYFAKALWENPEIYNAAIQRYALHRIGEPEEIGGVAAFLASDAATFITGQAIQVDGGATITGG